MNTPAVPPIDAPLASALQHVLAFSLAAAACGDDSNAAVSSQPAAAPRPSPSLRPRPRHPP